MTPQPDPAAALSEPRFLDAGEAALVVEFGDTVDPAINDRVLALDAVLRADPPAGTREFVPTYRSLMIHYDPLQIDRETLVAIVRRGMGAVVEGRGQATTWTLPCCYDPALAEDLDEAAQTGPHRDGGRVARLGGLSPTCGFRRATFYPACRRFHISSSDTGPASGAPIGGTASSRHSDAERLVSSAAGAPLCRGAQRLF